MNQTSEIAVRREIVVNAPRERAFATFIDMTSWWPLATHTIGAAPARASIIEPHVGGRWYAIDANGETCIIGHVLAYEPPERLVLSWEISCASTYDPSLRTEIDVRLYEESPGRTRLTLEHRGLEVYGERAEELRRLYESDTAWTYVLSRFEAALA